MGAMEGLISMKHSRNVLRRATVPLKAPPILTKNYSKLKENPPKTWWSAVAPSAFVVRNPPIGFWTPAPSRMVPSAIKAAALAMEALK